MSEVTTNWFLIRGLVRGGPHWVDFPKDFAKAQTNARIFCLDIPGNGLKNQEPSPLSVPEMSRLLRAEFRDIIARHPGPNQNNILVALSLGGMVVLDWLQRDPTGVDSAVLVNTSVRGLSPMHHRMNPKVYPNILKALGMKNVAARERMLVSIISNRTEAHDAVAAHWTAVHAQHPTSKANAMRQIFAAARFKPQLQKPQTPVLLVCGQGDRLVSPQCSESLHKLWGWDIQRHPTGGHNLSIDDSPWLVDVLGQWRAQRQQFA